MPWRKYGNEAEVEIRGMCTDNFRDPGPLYVKETSKSIKPDFPRNHLAFKNVSYKNYEESLHHSELFKLYSLPSNSLVK